MHQTCTGSIHRCFYLVPPCISGAREPSFCLSHGRAQGCILVHLYFYLHSYVLCDYSVHHARIFCSVHVCHLALCLVQGSPRSICRMVVCKAVSLVHLYLLPFMCSMSRSANQSMATLGSGSTVDGDRVSGVSGRSGSSGGYSCGNVACGM